AGRIGQDSWTKSRNRSSGSDPQFTNIEVVLFALRCPRRVRVSVGPQESRRRTFPEILRTGGNKIRASVPFKAAAILHQRRSIDFQEHSRPRRWPGEYLVLLDRGQVLIKKLRKKQVVLNPRSRSSYPWQNENQTSTERKNMSTSDKKQAASIVWFEIPADNLQRAREFYGNLFGWKINPFPGAEDYWHIDTAGADETP